MQSPAPRCRIIPCLDLANGRVVKGVNFVDLNDAGDPYEVALRYAEHGADEIELLNITGDEQNNTMIKKVLAQLKQHRQTPIIVGGGMRNLEQMQAMIDAGAAKVSINSAAVQKPELIRAAAQAFGSERLIIAIDALRNEVTAVTKTTTARSATVAEPTAAQAPATQPALHWEVCTQGGKKRTGLYAVQWAKQVAQLGAGEILLTSMDRDGTQAGFDLELTQAISQAVNLPIIASGGVGTLQHLADGVLKGGAQGVLAASIFHYGHYSIAQAKDFLRKQGIAVQSDS